jgi:hypothetical protein
MRKPKISFKSKLLIFEYKERYPLVTAFEISELFCVNDVTVKNLFEQGEIIVPSKINRKKRKKIK